MYILDPGCRPEKGGICASTVPTDRGCTDDYGHGTAVASLAMSPMYGVTAQAKHHCVKVGNSAGIDNDHIITAILRVVQHNSHGTKRGVVNLSIEGPKSDVLNAAANEASSDDMFFVISVGNFNSDACTRSPASATVDDPYTFNIASPDSKGAAATSTNFGSCVALSAPGVWASTESGTLSGTRYVLSLHFLFFPHFCLHLTQ